LNDGAEEPNVTGWGMEELSASSEPVCPADLHTKSRPGQIVSEGGPASNQENCGRPGSIKTLMS